MSGVIRRFCQFGICCLFCGILMQMHLRFFRAIGFEVHGSVQWWDCLIVGTFCWFPARWVLKGVRHVR